MKESELRRFLGKIKVALAEDKHLGTACWVWVANRDERGYGRLIIGSRRDGSRRLTRAHRLAYEHWVGCIPPQMELDHLCQRKFCVNPDHLEAVTHRENMERYLPNAMPRQVPSSCKRGHRYDQTNTYLDKDGVHHCRECRKQQARDFRQRTKSKEAVNTA